MLKCARFFASKVPVVFISNDVMAKMRAVGLSLDAQSLRGDAVDENALSFEMASSLENCDIKTLDATYKDNHFL